MDVESFPDPVHSTGGLSLVSSRVNVIIFSLDRRVFSTVSVLAYSISLIRLLSVFPLRSNSVSSESSVMPCDASLSNVCERRKPSYLPRPVTSLTAAVDDTCVMCKSGKHPFYSCYKFKTLPPDRMISTLKSNLNCLRPSHFVKECTSMNRRHKYQQPHHTLLHWESRPEHCESTGTSKQTEPSSATADSVFSHVAQAGPKSREPLLLTCHVLILSVPLPRQEISWIPHPLPPLSLSVWPNICICLVSVDKLSSPALVALHTNLLVRQLYVSVSLPCHLQARVFH